MIIFETERVSVRQFTIEDKMDFYRINSHPRVMEYIRPVKNQEETDHFLLINITQYKEQPQYGRWMAVEKQSLNCIGSFAIIPIEGTQKLQLGYALMPEWWGKGFATELTKGALDYIFNNTTLEFIYAVVEEPNEASKKVLSKVGFNPSGGRMEEGKKILEFVFSKLDYQLRKK
ncbi:MAG: GNAT family N-acetyltransferase; N-acetyltransferase [Chitinophagaceae bacterium]